MQAVSSYNLLTEQCGSIPEIFVPLTKSCKQGFSLRTPQGRVVSVIGIFNNHREDAHKAWAQTVDLGKRTVVLESCVQTEDVTDLKGGAVVHYQVATDNYVYVVWRRRRKYRF